MDNGIWDSYPVPMLVYHLKNILNGRGRIPAISGVGFAVSSMLHLSFLVVIIVLPSDGSTQ